jgi:hypothetical protein
VPTRHPKENVPIDQLATCLSAGAIFSKKIRIDPPKKANSVGTRTEVIGDADNPVKFPIKKPSIRNAYGMVSQFSAVYTIPTLVARRNIATSHQAPVMHDEPYADI